MPRAFMMFHTSGLKTGNVRLDTLITGFCCACAGEAAKPKIANVHAAANAARLRRHNWNIDTPPRGRFLS